MVIEQIKLRRKNVLLRAIPTIQAARRQSTCRMYDATWRSFCSWCTKHHADPTSSSVPEVLGFLQDGLDKHLSPNTLHRQVAALNTVLSLATKQTLSQDPVIRSFLPGVTNLCPPVIHRYSSWDLSLVLQVLMHPPL